MGINEIVKMVTEDLGCSGEVARKAINRVFRAITEATSAGETVKIQGFGSFRVKFRKAKPQSRNPKTGVITATPERYALTFKESLTHKKALN